MKLARPLAVLALLAVPIWLWVPHGASAAEPAAAQAAPVDSRVASAGCDTSTDLAAGKTVQQSITSGGRTRPYFLHLPAGYQDGEATPLILAFHGHNGTGADVEAYSGIDDLDAIAVYPVGAAGTDGGTSWQSAPYASDDVDDVQFVSDLLDGLQGSLCVDPDRIYATGKSNGGGFTALLACRLPHRIAAFATVSAAFYPGTTTGCDGSQPVPYLDFHGVADTTVPYAGGTSHGAKLPSLTDWMNDWVEHNGCTEPSSRTIGSDVTKYFWLGCTQDATVVHYKIANDGHTWPGDLVDSGPGASTRTISATDVMWSFFGKHPLDHRPL
ncbi:PHB depolymerase family esterase [Kineosporia mesophila]|uniref:PHB depolymerase family esterase n=1 Tax=Kineosporia mesophila TaxID=566012 RepID=A0ABP7AJV7_9ACTN|nr:PHB depolymerase family esterase [Kineosporia mesophila]MCD5352445.1 hypothetical protein [Kineosporia mesophila]